MGWAWKNSTKIKYKEQWYTVTELSKIIGLSEGAIYHRVRRGRPLDNESYVISERRINIGIDSYISVMERFYTKRYRIASYKQLRIDLQELQRMRKAA